MSIFASGRCSLHVPVAPKVGKVEKVLRGRDFSILLRIFAKMEKSLFLDNFEKTLQEGLLKVCDGLGVLSGEILESPDVSGRWDAFIKDYVGDAVENFNDYPQSAIAWAGFLGMGVAHRWDRDWARYSMDTYQDYYGERGFDDMDEHILRDILGLPLDSEEACRLSGALSSCAIATLGLIRHEGIESQTSNGFFVLVRAYTVMFRIGAAIELRRLGYKKIAI